MKNGRGRIMMCLGLILILSVIALSSANAGLFGLFGSKKDAPAKNTPKGTLLIFPFDQGEASSLPTEFGQVVAGDIKVMLTEDSKYFVYLFKEKSPTINRAKTENALKSTDTQPPFSDDMNKSLILAKLLAMDYTLVGSIDAYRVDVAQKAAIITLSAQVYDARSGKLVKTLLVTGKTPESTNAYTEDELRDIAKGDAVTKLLAEIVAPIRSSQPSAVAVPEPAPNK